MNSLQIIADVIKKSLDLTSDQIWIYNQRRNIPSTSGLNITIGRVAIQTYGNNAVQVGDAITSGQWFQESIAIDMFSKNTEAFDRVHEVVGALGSPLSTFIQQQTGISIARVPSSIVDTSGLEGAGMLFRTTITINVLSAYEQTLGATYFDPSTIQYSLDETEA
jgi:hypothetical protein